MAAPAALTERLLAPCVLHKPLVAHHEVFFSDYERLQPLHLAARDASPRESCASSIRGVSGIRVPLQVAVAAQVPSRGVSSGIPSRAGRYLDVVLARAGRLASHAPVLAVSSAARHPRGREALHDQHSIRPSRSPITNRRAVACRASDQAERPTSGGYDPIRSSETSRVSSVDRTLDCTDLLRYRLPRARAAAPLAAARLEQLATSGAAAAPLASRHWVEQGVSQAGSGLW